MRTEATEYVKLLDEFMRRVNKALDMVEERAVASLADYDMTSYQEAMTIAVHLDEILLEGKQEHPMFSRNSNDEEI
jgi:hypothetical protein